MPITIGSNINSLRAQRQLSLSQQSLGSVFERLSSGQRINRANDDAAGLAIAESLRTDRRVFNQATRNLNDGISVLNIADSTISELSGIIIRIRELSVQAANGSISNKQRKALDLEAQELREEFFRVSRSADYNGLRLFDGSIVDGLRLQGGYGVDGGIASSLGGVMGNGTFAGVANYSTGGAPQEVQLGDINGDGFLDMVSITGAGNSVVILQGNGDGTFAAAKTLNVGSFAGSVQLGDINGDGNLDIVTANFAAQNFSIFLNNGGGSFGSQIAVSAGGVAISSVVLGDLNGDGAVDLVGVSGSNEMSVALGNGNGTFQAARTQAAGDSPLTPQLADFNGDGLLDLVFANPPNDDVSVLLGRGNGTFGVEQNYTAGNGARAVAVGDMNEDGILDLVVANQTDNNFTILIGNGNGSFSTGVSSAAQAGTSPRSVTLGDVNGDGHLDIITGNYSSNNISVYLGTGSGSFSVQGSFTVGTTPRNVELGDVNGDGVLDFVTANSASANVSVGIGRTREGIAPILEFSLRTQADARQAIAPLERKLNSLSQQRGVIGAFQSRLYTGMNTLAAITENYAAAESNIRDIDVAFESSQLTRLTILQEASAAVLAQANLQPSLALKLLAPSNS